MTNASRDYDLEVVYGRVTQQAAKVYVRCRELPGGQQCTLRGTIRGPLCEGVRTLPMTATFRDLGAGESVLAFATVPDPTTWTQDLPGYYQVRVELCESERVIAELDQQLGLRTLGVFQQQLRWQGKRWVLRGVWVSDPDEDTLDACGEQRLSLIVPTPSDELLAEASRIGVPVWAELPELEDAASLTGLARWPAVCGVLLGENLHGQVLSTEAPNLLWAQFVKHDEAADPADWAEVVFRDAGNPDHVKRAAASHPLPIIAVRRLNESCATWQARTHCDRLQRDLAPHGDYAGYVVRR